MPKKYIFIFIFVIFFVATIFSNLFLVANETSAAGTEDQGSTPAGTVPLNNPLGTSDFNVLVGRIIFAILGVVGSLALVMFIYGGLVWMLAAGNAEAVTKGKNILIWATVGLVIIFTAYALIKFVFKSLLG